MAEGKGGSAAMIGILLVILVGIGGWNYHRNYQIEQAERSQTTFSGYDSASLEQLAEAYRAEVQGLEQQYQQLRGARTRVRQAAGVGAGVREFERIQRIGDRRRVVTGELASREARVLEIDAELARREALGQGFKLHFARLTGFQLPI